MEQTKYAFPTPAHEALGRSMQDRDAFEAGGDLQYIAGWIIRMEQEALGPLNNDQLLGVSDELHKHLCKLRDKPRERLWINEAKVYEYFEDLVDAFDDEDDERIEALRSTLKPADDPTWEQFLINLDNAVDFREDQDVWAQCADEVEKENLADYDDDVVQARIDEYAMQVLLQLPPTLYDDQLFLEVCRASEMFDEAIHSLVYLDPKRAAALYERAIDMYAAGDIESAMVLEGCLYNIGALAIRRPAESLRLWKKVLDHEDLTIAACGLRVAEEIVCTADNEVPAAFKPTLEAVLDARAV